MIRENGAYHAQLAPDYFKEPDPEGLVDFVENDSEWREAPGNRSFCVKRSRRASRAARRHSRAVAKPS